jgi:hypothetical protein
VKQRTIIGWKFFNDTIDGKAINSGRVYTTVALDDSKGRAKGVVAAEHRLPDSSHIQAIKHLPLPLVAEFEEEEVSDGKGGFKTVVTGIRPVELAPARAAKAA